MPSDLDRLAGAIKAVIAQLFPRLGYAGVYEYQVSSVSGDTLDLHPTNESMGLSDLARIPMLSGVAGASTRPSVGSVAIVAFRNSDPSKPFVLGYAPTETDKITFANGTAKVARVGDEVAIGTLYFTTAGTFAAYVPSGGTAPDPAPPTAATLIGKVSTGAAKVYA